MKLADLFKELGGSQNKLERIVRYHGKDAMTTIAIEEMAEVIKAITKIKRYGLTDEYKTDLEEEVADALICITELIMMGYVDISHVKDWQHLKINREIKRIRENK